MEKHLWTKEALISNIDIDHVPINGLVNKFLELVRLNHLACCFIDCFLVVRVELFKYVFTDISVLLLDFRGDFITISSYELFTTIP